MVSGHTLDLYGQAVLPKLADGPKTQLELDVPRYALEALGDAGLVVMKMHRSGCLGVQFWYDASQAPVQLRDCATMGMP